MSKRERAQYMHSLSPVDLRADSKLLISLCGRIAQLVRALASHARGRRFESYCDHHENQSLACLVKALNSSQVLKTHFPSPGTLRIVDKGPGRAEERAGFIADQARPL